MECLNEKGAEAFHELQEGQHLGRYVVVKKIGQGNMGVVYTAYDPKLDRSVALKLLRKRGAKEQERLLREAKAMARLNHANVVAVHDVGAVGEQAFVAMEHVAGLNLRQQLAVRSHSWKEILSLFCAAGEGLAAAHLSGIVHRDFKADNVLIGADGRVRVSDFGLVQLQEDSTKGSAQEQADELQLTQAGELQLTQAGAVLGTPMYMAPECMRGQPADTRSDQYSFAASLYEALYGVAPFRSTNMETLQSDVMSGHLQATTGRSVPASLRRLVLRGMSLSPDERFSNMSVFTAELERLHGRGRQRLLWAAGGALVCLSILGLQLGQGTSQAPVVLCQGAGAELVGVWDATVSANVESAFLASEHERAKTTSKIVRERFDEYSQDWKEMHQATCEATHEQGSQSSELMDLRMHCLRRRALELGAQARLFERRGSEPAIVKSATLATRRLSPVADCAKVDSLQALAPRPAAAAQRIDEIEVRLAEQLAMARTGLAQDALRLAEPLAESTEDLAYAPLRGLVLYQLAMAQIDTGDYVTSEKTLEAALGQASMGKDDRLIADVWLGLIQTVRMQDRYEDAFAMRVWAETAVERAGNDPDQRKRFVSGISQLAISTGNSLVAIPLLEESLATTVARAGADHVNVANASGNLGAAHLELGNYAEARKLFERALEIMEIKRPGHPSIGMSHANLAGVFEALGDFERAEQHMKKGVEVFTTALGPEHPYVAGAWLSYGSLFSAQGKNKEAQEYFTRALALERKIGGEACVGAAEVLLNIANSHLDAGHEKVAITHFDDAMEIFTKELPPLHPLLGSATRGLGYAYLEQRKFQIAQGYFEQALAIHLEVDTSAEKLADVKMGLARSLWHQQERERSLLMAQEAKEGYMQSEGSSEPLDFAVKWLSVHQ